MNYHQIYRSVGAFVVVLAIGSIGGMLFWIFRACGLIKVRGYRKLLQEVDKGNLIIASNHPSLLETVIIPVMFWPWALFNIRKRFVWSMPASELFPSWLSWLYDFSHCIKVDRYGSNNLRALTQATKILKAGGTLVIHPEAGRTDSPVRGKRIPKKQFGQRENRKIRRITTMVPRLARNTHAQVLPIWIDVPFKDANNGFKKAFWIWLRGWHTVTINVGKVFTFPDYENIPADLQLHLDNKLLGDSILQA